MTTLGDASIPAPAVADRVASGDARTLELRRGEISNKQLKALEEVGRGFDALFANTLLAELMKPLQGAGFGGSGPGSSVVQGMIQSNLADHLAAGKGLGIGRMVVESMKPLLAADKVTVEDLARGLSAAGAAKERAASAAAAAPLASPLGEAK